MRGYGRSALLVSSAIICVVATPAAAQTKSFDVPAQSAQSAIRQLGRQADVQIIAARKVTQGKQTNSVRGNMTVEQALETMFAGTGLVARPTGAGAWTIVPLGSASAASGAQAGRGQAVLVGSVRDHATGSALKGARVEVVETGDATSTGDLGDFRFARLPAGDVTLRISYLGFPEQTETVAVVGGFSNRTDIYLGAGATSEIVVYGQVSARAQALNQERTAENSTTVISGDLLGNFNGTTISEALRRAPGVAFQQNPITGDGANIIVRGLSPDYNQIALNGIPLPEASGTGRSASLDNLLSDSVSEIKISKTLLANQDSYGTGGLVEIETKSPLDRPKRYFNLSADGTKYGKGFGEEYLLSGTASLRFGAEGDFGISASIQQRKQDISAFTYGINGSFGGYLPLLPNGVPASPGTLDPRTPFPFYDGAAYVARGVNLSSLHSKVDTRNVNLSAAWQVSPGTSLRIDYVNSRRSEDRFNNFYEIFTNSAYALAPIPGLGGEERYVLQDPEGQLYTRSRLSLSKQTSTTDSISFRGDSAFGALTLKYNIGYTRGKLDDPFNGELILTRFPGLPVDSENFLQQAFDPFTGSVISAFAPRSGRALPAPLLTPAGFARLRDDDLNLISSYYAALDQSGQSSNWNGGLSGKYEFNSGIFKYLEFGGEYTRASFSNVGADSFGFTPVYDENGFPVPTGDLGLEYADLPFATGSGAQVFRLITQQSFEQLLTRIDEFAAAGLIVPAGGTLDPILRDQGTREEALAGYVQLRADIGKLEIIAGVRLDRNRVDSKFINSDFIFDENFGLDVDFYLSRFRIFDEGDTLTTTLPRVLLNFRPRDNIVLRAGYYSTVARPQISQLNAERSLVYYAARLFGPTGTQPYLSIRAGNPALKPAWTHNFDVSGEWYDGKVGVIKLSAFYKRINRLIEANQILGSAALEGYDIPDQPVLNNLPADTFIEFTYPVNNPDPATVWGIEAAVERRLDFLPGVLSGLGVYANVVYTRSKKTQQFNFLAPVFDGSGAITDYEQVRYQLTLPFNQSPRYSGTVGLTYTRPGLDASLYYTAQARRQISGGAAYGMDPYAEAVDSLDLRATYQFKLAGSDIRLTFEGKDLLKGRSSPANEQSFGGVAGLPKYYSSGVFLGGRRFSLGLSASF